MIHFSPLPFTANTAWTYFELAHYHLVKASTFRHDTRLHRIYLVLSGSAAVPACDLITAGVDEVISISCHMPAELIQFGIDPRLLQHLAKKRGLRSKVELKRCIGLRDSNIVNLLQLLRSTGDSELRIGSAYGEQLALALTVYLLERYCNFYPRQSVTNNCLPGPTLRRVLSYIDERLAQSLTLEELARLAGVSRFYFVRLFCNSVGQTPAQYILTRRIDHAQSLMRNPSITMREIAESAGFANPSHFSSVFRSRKGLTPTQYCSTLSADVRNPELIPLQMHATHSMIL